MTAIDTPQITSVPKPRILLINPNSSHEMTNSLTALTHQYTSIISTYAAPPPSPLSINNETDALNSASIVFPEIQVFIAENKYDGYLVACYSLHPLVEMIRAVLPRGSGVFVMGIFEASLVTALSLLPTPGTNNQKPMMKFGIVTTGKSWESALSSGVRSIFGLEELSHTQRFKGVVSTGLNADELHTAPEEVVRGELKEATKRLLQGGDVGVICLGCAGMSGLGEMVKEAVVEELGEDGGRDVYVLDGVKAGLGILENLLRCFAGQV